MAHLYVCDCCNTPVKNTVYKISFGAVSIRTDFTGTNTEALGFNLAQGMAPERFYCHNCMQKVKDLLKPKPKE